MIQNPYYRILGLLDGGNLKLALATLTDAEGQIFRMEGKKAPIAGRAKGLTIDGADEGGTFLCLGSPGGWFVLCRLEEL